MYSTLPYAISQVLIETIYSAIQTAIYCLIIYSMIGFEWTAAKFLSFYYFMLMCLIFYTLYGMMIVAVTPSYQIAATCNSFFLSIWNTFSGFVIPRMQIPIWWRWYYWAVPNAWTLYGIVTSQLGDQNTQLQIPGAGNMGLKELLKESLGYDYHFLPVVAIVHIAWVLLFLFVFAYSIKFLNFQKR
ncbi:ABC transporter G family member 34, partial [Mucuna pruriens]